MNTFGKVMTWVVIGATTVIVTECLFAFLDGIGFVANGVTTNDVKDLNNIASQFTTCNNKSTNDSNGDLSSGYRDESSM